MVGRPIGLPTIIYTFAKATVLRSLSLFTLCFFATLLRLRIHASFLTLLWRNGSGGLGQRVVATTGLGERNNVADGIGLGQQGHDTIPAECQTTVRRSAELESIQQEAKLLLCFLFADAHDAEYTFLHIATVDTDRSATNFVAIADDVISVGQSITRILVKLVQPLA